MKPKKQNPAPDSGSDPNRSPRRTRRLSEGKTTVKPALPPVRPLTPDGSLTIRIPLTFARRGGRKRIITPEGKTFGPVSQGDEATTLVKAIARAHRWKRLLEEGRYTSVQDLAIAEKITPSFLARILRLTLLAPDIVEKAIQNPKADRPLIDALMQPFPLEWAAQRAALL